MDTKIFVWLRPIGRPCCRITVGDQVKDFILEQETTIELICTSSGSLNIEHYGKLDKDPDTAIIIEQIQFNEITDPSFVWAGIYYPKYPLHLSGASELKYHNYLSWNGSWRLDFSLPIYTWIHKTLDLGWIYD
jgi:hypothetical protein